MMWLLLLQAAFAFDLSDWEARWQSVVRVSDQHPQYVIGRNMIEPQGTWQLLLGVVVALDAPSGFKKDCLWIKIPTKDRPDGEAKLMSLDYSQDCAQSLENVPLFHAPDLSALQYDLRGRDLVFGMTGSNGRVNQLRTSFMNLPLGTESIGETSLYESSVPLRSTRGAFFFSLDGKVDVKGKDLLVGKLDDQYPAMPCSFEDGSCFVCRYGVYRLPLIEEKKFYCGIDRCGEKNQPACWRGLRWQKNRDKRECRGNTDYVFCTPGLRVECEGELALCR